MSYFDGKTVEFRPLLDNKDRTYWEALIRHLDMGGKVTVHDVVHTTLVLKVAGHNYSVGWGVTEYQPAHFLVLKTEGPVKLDRMYPTKSVIESFVIEFPVTANKG